MELSKTYAHGEIEAQWYCHWLDLGAFRPKKDGQAFSMVIPPPTHSGWSYIEI